MKTRGIALSAAFATAFWSVACRDNPVGPEQHPTSPGILLSQATVPSSDWTPTLTPLNSQDDVGPILFGSYLYPALIKVNASGRIYPYVNWGEPPPNGYYGVNVEGAWYGPGGIPTGCSPHISVISSVQGGGGFCYLSWNQVTDTDSAYIYANKDMSVMWNHGPGDIHGDGPCGLSGQPPCYLYTAGTGYLIRVHKPSVDLSLLPDVVNLPEAAGGPVTFTFSFAPSSYQGYALPVSVLHWRFKPDNDAEVNLPCSIFNTVCSFTATQSGTVYADVAAQGDSVRLQGRVQLPCPPTPDSTLNAPGVRELLMQEFANSLLENKERAGWLYGNPTTGELLVEPPIATTRCSFKLFSPPPQKSGYVLLGGFHTHPILPGDRVQPGCPSKGPNDRVDNGPSPDRDIPFVEETQFKHFIIDHDEVFVLVPGSWYRLHRKPNGCFA